MPEPEDRRRAVAATLLPGFEGTILPTWLATRLRNGLGGVCLFGENIVSAEQLSALTASILDANPRALIAIDEEGGDVTRLHYASGSPLPGNAILGRIDDLEYTEQIANRIGWELRSSGINLDFAPDADINSNSENPVIGVRSFGTDPAAVGAHVAAWTRGIQSTGVAACAKHFPGHGDTAEDSHLALPVVDRSLESVRERELVPFVAAIAAGTKSIMSSHILLPQLDAAQPATFSSAILEDLLRVELGFEGVIVSDALDMAGASGPIGIPEAAVRAIGAGCDLLCIGTRNTDSQIAEIERHILHALDDGVLAETRVTAAAHRVHTMADELAREQRRLGSNVPLIDAAGQDDQDCIRAGGVFDVKVGVPGILSEATNLRLVTIDGIANSAVGRVPWGIASELAADPGRYQATVLTGTDDSEPAVVIVVGRDIHRHPAARSTVDHLRANNSRVIVVDMGWPGDDRAYADIATFGASRLAGRALANYLIRETA